MADPRHRLGIDAEAAVARWLERAGWTIRGRRARHPGGGEVDLIAVDPDGVLVAVEVRARRTARTGAAAVTVDAARVRRVARTLVAHARAADIAWPALRVDLVSVEQTPGTPGTPRTWRLRRIPGVDAW